MTTLAELRALAERLRKYAKARADNAYLDALLRDSADGLDALVEVAEAAQDTLPKEEYRGDCTCVFCNQTRRLREALAALAADQEPGK